MKKIIRCLVCILVLGVYSQVFALDNTSKTYTAYSIGDALGKASHKSFSAMNQEIIKKDFILGFDDTILDHKPDINKISDKDSYEVGMIIVTQYKSKLKKMVVINKPNCEEFVKGFNDGANSKDQSLTSEDKEILKHFRISKDDDN
ncbi:hypothetical protein [Francisella orientalis]|uniref:Domain amino terminal to FKBP-type peptidyl-prolyl isomerase family protein n=1 Tax=Francisella orientalis TaxID=299583 RepID=A0AAP6X6Q2_9GAMM|nr:hypothetical protein [Francisella orientalis]AFJ43439.1 hypothetical protein OOM_0975 [Francisella orientalis str. Toba 04]AHB98459.1 hypothetical protein M973_05760 [Francisella orientalis LADL 07-285A]AKN85662.1 hypothetical protein FNO12_1019 [Francisella orientalis FNO12]AKN87202.1 Hypothetical protein FNO24_1021 [Francisella orientalis FNO24]AKN88739.1 Hypothetical protein FNO190_1019 [Francisella orientalis]